MIERKTSNPKAVASPIPRPGNRSARDQRHLVPRPARPPARPSTITRNPRRPGPTSEAADGCQPGPDAPTATTSKGALLLSTSRSCSSSSACSRLCGHIELFGYNYHREEPQNHHSFLNPNPENCRSRSPLPPVTSAQPAPARPPTSPQARTARPTGGGHEREPGPERRKSAALRLTGAAAGSPQGSQSWRTVRNLFVRPLCLRAFVVWSVVAGYNYLLIVIANRRHCFPNPRPENCPSDASTPDSQACPAPERERLRACGPAWRTAAVAPDGLGLRAAPPTRPEDSGKNILFSSELLGFAPSREPVISARLAHQH